MVNFREQRRAKTKKKQHLTYGLAMGSKSLSKYTQPTTSVTQHHYHSTSALKQQVDPHLHSSRATNPKQGTPAAPPTASLYFSNKPSTLVNIKRIQKNNSSTSSTPITPTILHGLARSKRGTRISSTPRNRPNATAPVAENRHQITHYTQALQSNPQLELSLDFH
ncbi:hypothetical protein Droror1_Dr00017005 [Drosera rotundifolia]